MQVNPYTYTCDELYMASPLEKKQRTGSVNITENMDCPVLVYGSCWTLSRYEGRASQGGGYKVWMVEGEEKGFRSG